MKAINQCNAIVTNPSIEQDRLELAINFLESKWPLCDRAYNVYEAKILSDELSKPEDVEREQEEYYEFWDHYQLKLLEYKSVLREEQVKSTGNNQVHEVSVKPKLPTLKLPVFSGDYTEFESFYDQFSSQIGTRTDLDNVTKLQYLKSQRQGSPLELVKGFPSTSENYKHALDTLKGTYGDTERLKRALLYQMIDLEVPRSNRGDLEKFRIALVNFSKSLLNKQLYMM